MEHPSIQFHICLDRDGKQKKKKPVESSDTSPVYAVLVSTHIKQSPCDEPEVQDYLTHELSSIYYQLLRLLLYSNIFWLYQKQLVIITTRQSVIAGRKPSLARSNIYPAGK